MCMTRLEAMQAEQHDLALGEQTKVELSEPASFAAIGRASTTVPNRAVRIQNHES